MNSHAAKFITTNGSAAMTFAEIARALGISKASAWQLYRRGMKKLRDSKRVELLRDTAGELDRERARR
ncbi:MAG: hypothetical protein CXZ00_03110 [Acidobacteria bacterium]|nr:MAG: hypothetical protein CXZ00_03110 [Acidobacteriota bacterium]